MRNCLLFLFMFTLSGLAGTAKVALGIPQSESWHLRPVSFTPQSDRMEDRGCCVLKKSKYKPEWDYADNESRRSCASTAKNIGVDYDFYKDQKCDAIK